MLRRPPRTTLFPYNDALPISDTIEQLICRELSSDDVSREVKKRLTVVAGSRGYLHVLQTLAAQNHITRSEEHTSELQSRPHLVCRLLLEKKKRHKSTLSIREH